MAAGNARRRKANKKSTVLVICVTAVFVMILGLGIWRMNTMNRELELNKAALEYNVTEANARGEALEKQRGKGLTESEVIRIAREKFGLIFKDEIIFVPEN